jgi:acyl-coenzyme A thioesterase PaaI-like protein
MAIAARTLQPDGAGVATIEMKTSFMQAGPTRGRLVAAGSSVHRSGSMAFCEAEVRGEADQLVAGASGTFKLLRHRPEDRDP